MTTGEYELDAFDARAASQPPRVDLRDKVTGRAVYVEDIPDLPGTVYAASIRSPYAHARIRGIDAAAALALPGVLGIVDREHLADLDVEPDAPPVLDPDFIVTDKARYQGDLVGVVVAENHRLARYAADLVDVDWEILPPVFTSAEALAPGAPRLHEHLSSNEAFQETLAWGDVQQGFATADRVLEFQFEAPTVFHHPMEPIGTGLVWWEDGVAQIWAPSNTPIRDTEGAARCLRVPRQRVRLRVPCIGGGFGAKKVTRDMVAALALSRKLARPVRLLASAEESFHVAVRHAMSFTCKVGVSNDGMLVALDVDFLVDCGSYMAGGRTAARNAATGSWGCYRVPHYRAAGRAVYTNKTPATPHRGTGKTQSTYVIEVMMDELARQVGMDPVSFRERNVLPLGSRLTSPVVVRGQEVELQVPPVDCDLSQLARDVLGALPPTEASPVGGSLRRGRGIALSFRHTSKGEQAASAEVQLEADGTVRIIHNASDLGQGVYSTLSLIAARTLDLPQAQVQVDAPDTGNGLTFPGVSSQRTTVQMGNAVVAACEALREQLIDFAVEVHGGQHSDWSYSEGKLWKGGAEHSVPDLLRTTPPFALKAVGKDADAESVPSDAAYGAFDFWSPGAAAAEVEVDLESGEFRVTSFAVSADAGAVIHYSSARAQLEGGAVMGFGLALTEELVYGEGQTLNADSFQYRLPQMQDLPQAFATVIEESGRGPGPFGSKGIAQVSIPCVAPAIANAIADATGVVITSMPITAEKILRALGRL